MIPESRKTAVAEEDVSRTIVAVVAVLTLHGEMFGVSGVID